MTEKKPEEEDAIIYPIAFNIEEANREIDIAEQELNEGKGITESEMHQFFENIRSSVLAEEENPLPCVFHSKEELIAAIRRSEEQFERGEYLTSEEMDKEIESWFNEDI